MPTRPGSLLAASLSGKKPPPSPSAVAASSFSSEEESDIDRRTVADFRRLSTLYGCDVRGAGRTKGRRRSGLVVEAKSRGESGRSLPASFTGNGSGAGPASGGALGGVRPMTGRKNTARSSGYDYDPAVRVRTANPNPHTAASTIMRLKEMKANKQQSMTEPPTTRLSRPKSAVPKFSGSVRAALPLKETTLLPVHDDATVSRPWFFGYSNNPSPPSALPFAHANRYGYRGAKEVIRKSSERAGRIGGGTPEGIEVERDLARPDEWGE